MHNVSIKPREQRPGRGGRTGAGRTGGVRTGASEEANPENANASCRTGAAVAPGNGAYGDGV